MIELLLTVEFWAGVLIGFGVVLLYQLARHTSYSRWRIDEIWKHGPDALEGLPDYNILWKRPFLWDWEKLRK